MREELLRASFVTRSMTKSNKPKRIRVYTAKQKARAKEIRRTRAEMNPEQLKAAKKRTRAEMNPGQLKAAKQYHNTEQGKASKAKAQKKYQATEQGK